MSLRTQGFVGARLREARVMIELSATALAEQLEISPQSLYAYESGKAVPSNETTEKLSELLKVPKTAFLNPVSYDGHETVFFRSLNSATKASRERSEVINRRFKEIVDYLESFLDFPSLDLPEFDLPDDPRKLDMDDIEGIATQLREHWGIGEKPLGNIVALVEAKAGFVHRYKLASPKLDGLSSRSKAGKWVITLNKDKETAVRSRFDIAHELGHLILHENVDRSRLNDKVFFKLIEDQAHRFAAAFLVPENAFLSEYISPDLDMLLSMKQRWRASVAMLIVRAKDLDVMPPDRVEKVWRAYAWRKWRGHEPFDGEWKTEEPALAKIGFEVLFEEHLQTPDDVLLNLPFGGKRIEEIVGLPEGFITGKKVEHVIKLKPKSRKTKKTDMQEGEVIEFPKRN